MKLFEFEFINVRNGIKRAWGLDVYEALNALGFNDPVRAMLGVVLAYKQIAEVQP